MRAYAPRLVPRLVPLAVALLACTDDAPPPTAPRAEAPRPSAAVAAPPGASVSQTVQVPASMRTPPFDVTRKLVVPPNFTIAVHARVSGARFMAVAPNGDLLVSRPGAGRVMRVRASTTGGDPIVSDYITGLRRPHDLVFYTISGITYLYVAESHQVNRYTYNASTGLVSGRVVVVSGLPDASSPELNGTYGHELKNIALGGGYLYVSIASTCNACTSDTQSSPVRGSIYRYPAAGGTRRLFARGLRNAEGLAFVPGTTTLWVVVNNRDDIAYPFHNDYNGNGSIDYGKVFPAYIDDHPPELFTSVHDGGNYGWPFCNSNPDSPSKLVDMPFDRDVQYNADGSKLDCATATRPRQGIQAHSAPLGLTFLQNTSFASPYRNGAAIALHGSWNRTVKTGYKVIHFAWDAAAGRPGPQIDLVSGWLAGGTWGRPVDVAVSKAGHLFISDDYSGTIYRLTYTPPTFTTQRYEAEQARLYSSAVNNTRTGFSGMGYVNYLSWSGAYSEWTVSVPTAGPYTLGLQYALLEGSRPLRITVNGTTVASSLSFPVTGSWSVWNRVSLAASLAAGQNTVRATTIGYDGPNMDYLAVSQ